MTVRQEREQDFGIVKDLVRRAFAAAEHSDGDEHELAGRLRSTPDYIPALSLVAESHGTVVGHIMMSKVCIGDAPALALAPLSVHPGCQRSGIGSMLVREAHRRAIALGFGCSVVLGSPLYYHRFGYETASSFGIEPPFDVSDGLFMACRFTAGKKMPSGIVRYSAAFGLD